MKKVLYIGLDVHKETIVIAAAAEGRKEAREFKTIPSDYTRLYNNTRLHSALGCIAPTDKLHGREAEIFATRDAKLQEARRDRAANRRHAKTEKKC